MKVIIIIIRSRRIRRRLLIICTLMDVSETCTGVCYEGTFSCVHKDFYLDFMYRFINVIQCESKNSCITELRRLFTPAAVCPITKTDMQMRNWGYFS